MKTITITNQKGGTAKTTTAHTLATGLASMGLKVLAIDLDQQSNLSVMLQSKDEAPTVLDVLNNTCTPQEAIQRANGLDFISASKGLFNAPSILTGKDKAQRLKGLIKPLKARYDYIIIDTSPSLSILTINALVSSDLVIIPVQPEIMSLSGVLDFKDTIEAVKQNGGQIEIAGLLLTKYHARSSLDNSMLDVARNVAEKLNTKVYTQTIREAQAIREAQIYRQSIFEYAPRSKVAEDYKLFIEEFLKGM